MKKLLLILLTVLTCFGAEAIVHTNHITSAAAIAASQSAARRRRIENEQHAKDFHHGTLLYEVSLCEDVFTYKGTIPIIESYEVQRYYYEIDPDKCAIKTEEVLKASRDATDYEIKAHKNTKILVTSLFVLGLIAVVLLFILVV